MSATENPLAFPVWSIDGFTQYGMDLRDYFAGQVIAGMASNPSNPAKNREDAAELSYAMADAMLAERAKAGQP